MRGFSFLLVLILAVPALAEITVVKVKGNQAIVRIKDETMNPGDKLKMENAIEGEEGTDKKSIDVSLRKRTHRVSWKIDSYSTKTDLKVSTPTTTTSSSTDSTTQKTTLGYAYNFKRFAIGVDFTSDFSSGFGTWSKSRVTILNGRINVIEDIPGNDYIPWASIGIGSYSVQDQGTSEGAGPAREARLGLDWYPFGELFAVSPSVYLQQVTLKIDDPTSGVSVEANPTATGFTLGWSLVF